MGQTREQKIIKQLSGTVQKQTPIATDMFLPNHSGDHSAGIVNSTPTNDTDLVNKKYVDDEVAGVTGLWEVDGTETQLKTADEIDMQFKKLVNLAHPVGPRDAADREYVDEQISDVAFWELDGTEVQLLVARDVDMRSKNLTNVLDPGVDQDAATKKYVDDEDAAADAHITADGTSHSHVGLNDTHRGSAGTDHSDVGLNNSHRIGDGSDHADVAANSASIISGAAAIGLNTTHRTSNGTDHGYINQDVQSSASPTFNDLGITSGTVQDAPAAAKDLINLEYLESVMETKFLNTALSAIEDTYDNATTTNTSANITCEDYRHATFSCVLAKANTPTNIIFECEVSNDGTNYVRLINDFWGKVIETDTSVGTGKTIGLEFPISFAKMRIKVTASGTTAANTFTITNADLYLRN
jgi:hypothetical protein